MLQSVPFRTSIYGTKRRQAETPKRSPQLKKWNASIYGMTFQSQGWERGKTGCQNGFNELGQAWKGVTAHSSYSRGLHKVQNWTAGSRCSAGWVHNARYSSDTLLKGWAELSESSPSLRCLIRQHWAGYILTLCWSNLMRKQKARRLGLCHII